MARRATATAKTYGFTAADIIRERDENKLAWRGVAEALGLKSPSAARTAYTELTGIPHYESQVKVARAPKGTGVRAQVQHTRRALHQRWDVDSDQDEIIERLSPKLNEKGEVRALAKIVVERQPTFTGGSELPAHREELEIQTLIGLHYEQDDTVLAIDFIESYTGNQRCCRVNNIVEVW
jgi:hypothetical protein